ncbi:MAG TPA: TetR/AcrR family transcriptional regulator [Croceibacterium sp.]|nr:TetR/AcrR family transcriptional regulator [Croceibacterium sp.]
MEHETLAPPSGKRDASTSERVLAATERLCAERGLELVSIRDIAREAGVSLSVIYHHFGSKIDLLKTLIERRLGELFCLRQPMIDRLEAQAQPSLEELLYAMIAPLSLLRKRGKDGEITGLFLARVLISTVPEIKHEIDRGAGRLTQIVDLAQRAAPHLSRVDVCWRLHFTLGIERMHQWDYDRLEIMSEGACAQSVDEAINRAVAFAKAGFLAP